MPDDVSPNVDGRSVDDIITNMMQQQSVTPEQRMQEIKLYDQIQGPSRLPRPRPPEADIQPNPEDVEWEKMSEKQKLIKRKEQTRTYNEIMKGK